MNKTFVWLAALCLLGGAAHAAEPPPSANGGSPAAVTAPPAPSPDVQETAGPGEKTEAVEEAPGPEAPPMPMSSPPPAAAPGVEPAPARTPSMVPVAHSPTYLSIDFTDVELPVLIKFISEQTKKNFIFDDRVQGKVTIISPRRVTLEEAYDVFLLVLQTKGFTTVTQGNTTRIIVAREARQDPIPTGVSKDTPSAEFITRLVPLQYLETTEVVPLVTPLISKDGMVSAFGSSNTLLLIDSRANIDRIVKILGEVDTEGAPATLQIYPLSFAVAADVAKTLNSIFLEGPPAAAAQAARGRARMGAIRPSRHVAVKFLADARTNSLIVHAGQDMQDDVADVLKKIDIPASAGGGKINVYYLENADAEEVSKVLASLSPEKRAGAPTPAPGARTPPATTGGAVVSAELEGGVKVTADKATNALIIVASANDYETLLGVIKRLDIRRRQVFVEAVIMEITLDKSRELGAEFRGAVQTGGSGAAISGTNFGFTGGVNDLISAISAGTALSFSGTGLTLGGTLGKVTLSDGTQIPAITAVLRAAETRDYVNILSSPHLLTLDNKEAEIIVGENVPFITSTSRDSTNLANVINTVERKDVGITLRITPHIHESEFMNMEIYQESSAVKSTSDSATVGPTTTKRSTKTSVLVKNGDTVVIGGMMQETFSTSESQVPLLGDIPLLGYLFKYKSISRKKTNLLIFLTPNIIKEPKDLANVSEKQKKRMDTFVEQNKDGTKGVLPMKKENDH